MSDEKREHQIVSAAFLAEVLGTAKGQVMGEIDAKIGVVISLLFKAGIIDRDMLLETIREHTQVHDDVYIRDRLEEMLQLCEQRPASLSVIEGGKMD